MRRVLALSVVLLALAGCNHMKPASAPPPASVAADEAKIKALMEQHAAAITAKNFDGLMSQYSDDVFVFDVVPPRAYVGTAAYRADWEGIKGLRDFKLEISDLSIDVASDGQLAWGHCIHHSTGTLPIGKKTQKYELTTRVTDVYKKINGEWKIIHEHVSVPVDLVHGAKPDLSSKP